MNDNVEKTEGTAGEIVLYQPDEKTAMEVRLDATFDTVWLTQQQIAELFGAQNAAISKHMMNIFSSSHRKQKKKPIEMAGMRYKKVILMGRMQKTDGTSRCFAQIENIRRQSITNS